jgi:hypothetical protein
MVSSLQDKASKPSKKGSEKEKRNFVLALPSQMQKFKIGKMEKTNYRQQAKQRMIYISLQNTEKELRGQS